MKTTIDLRVVSFKKADLPYLDSVGKKMYYLIAHVGRVKEDLIILENWREINPRFPNTKSDVAKEILDTLENDPASFVAKNIGLTLLIDKVSYDNKTENAQITLSSKDLHGLLNGGNTFQIVLDFLEENEVPENAFIRIELLEGYKTREEVVELVDARNTSKQVEEVSLMHLDHKFDWIMNNLAGTPYGHRVAYTENDPKMATGKKKDLTVTEIISYLLCFDLENEPNPVWVYSQKSKVLAYYNENFKRLESYAPILDKILKTRDRALELLQTNDIKRLESVRKSRNKNGIELPFSEKIVSHKIPIGFIYPLLSPLRVLVEQEGRSPAKFKSDPQKALDKVGKIYERTLADWMEDAGTPTKLGKMKSFWDTAGTKIRYELSK